MADSLISARARGSIQMGSANTRGEPLPFEPPLTLTDEVVSWVNEVAAPRVVLQSRLGDEPLFVRMSRLVWHAEPSAVSMLDCVVRVGDDMAILSLPCRLAEALISTVQQGLTLPSDPTRSLLLELALESWLTRLEALFARDLQLVRIDEARTEGPYLEFDTAYGPLTDKARLFLFSPLDRRVPPAFGILAQLLGQLPLEMPKLSPEIPVTVAIEIGSLRVSIALLRQAQGGDALLPDIIPFAQHIVILNADKLWAPAQVAGARLVLQGPFRLQPHPLECAHMTPRPQAQQLVPPSEADIDNIEITLVFECGRWPIPFGTLRNVNEGYVFDLGRPLDGPVDILANGRLIGRGDIVRVGEELAVRLRDRLAVNE